MNEPGSCSDENREVSGQLCDSIASWVGEEIEHHERWLSDELRWIPTGSYRYTSVDFDKFYELFRIALRLEALVSFPSITPVFADRASIPLKEVEDRFFAGGAKKYHVKEAAIVEGIIRRSLEENMPPAVESLDRELPVRGNPHLVLN